MKVQDTLNRRMLGAQFPDNPRFVRAMEQQAKAVDDATSGLETTAGATDAMQDASVIVLAPNEAFKGERVLVLGRGLAGTDDGSTLEIKTATTVPLATEGFTLLFALSGDTVIALPLTGTLATIGNIETLTNKTLNAPKLSGLGNYADDAAAATGGVPVGGVYRNGSQVMVRVS